MGGWEREKAGLEAEGMEQESSRVACPVALGRICQETGLIWHVAFLMRKGTRAEMGSNIADGFEQPTMAKMKSRAGGPHRHTERETH